MVSRAPELRIQALENQSGAVVPTPLEVVSQIAQHRNAFGKIREMFFLHRSGASLLPHARLKAIRKVVELLVSEVAHMSDAEGRLLDLTLSLANLDTEFVVEAANQSLDVETRKKDHSGNTIARPSRINLHLRLANQRSNTVRHLRTPGKNRFFPLSVNEIQRCLQLKQKRERRCEGNRSLVL